MPHRITIIAILIVLSSSIMQTCDYTQMPTSCGKNSFCNDKNWCECQDGWVLDCTVAAHTITQNDQTFQISQTPSYFTIVPSSDQIIFVYRFYLCTLENQERISLNLTLFADQGIQTQFNKQNEIGQIGIDSKNQCWPLFSPYMQFGIQPNGKIQQMILKINSYTRQTRLNLKIGDNQYSFGTIPQNNLQSPKSTKLTLKVNQIYFIKISTLWLIVISFLSLILISFVAGIVYCVIALRNGRRITDRFLDNNLDHFEHMLPKQKLRVNDERIGHPCPVCLLQFQQKQQVRKTSCNHTFHYECLDVWCKKNLNCPVCRCSLQKSFLKQKSQKQEGKHSCKQLNINASQIYELQQELEDPTELSEHRKKNMRQKLIS